LLFANKPGHRMSAGISAYLPRLGLSALFMCLFSGIVLTFYYRPMGNVFQNVEEITTLVPYGWFFRQLHFASGQLFVILMLIHAVDHFHRKRYRLYPGGQWQRLIFSLCLCFYTLFTGFILKGDKEGLFAAKIFMGITGNIPLVGNRLSSLFIQPGDALFFLPYLYHCFFLPILILYLIRTHIKRWFPEQGLLYTGAAGLCLYALWVKPFMDIPPRCFRRLRNRSLVFSGATDVVENSSDDPAGIVLPGGFLCGVLILPYVEKMGVELEAPKSGVRIVSACLHWLIVLVFLSYALLTLKTAFWEP
jgi:cytochrome b561